MGVWVLEGRESLSRIGAELDDLHEAVRTPVTSRRIWLQSWVESYPEYRPTVVGLGATDGTLAAAALLATRGPRQLVMCGHGPSDAVTMPARDATSAALLAVGLVEELEQRRRPWRLILRHLVPGDVVAPYLARRLAHAALVPGDVSPVLNAQDGASLSSYVTSSHRRGVSRIRNRMTRDGLAPEVQHLGAPSDVLAALPEVERVYRARDESLGRACPLDARSHRDFFRKVVGRHAASGQVCLTTLRLRGRLAAYVLCFLDGDVSRMWNCRFDPPLEKYSPGKLAMDESVSHALNTGCTTYDFMRGAERYKASYANDQVTALDLYASSGPLVAAGNAVFLAARDRMRSAKESGGAGARIVSEARRLRDRWDII